MLYKTTGHTLGSQSIAVNTKKGIVVYIGDLSHFYCTLFPWYGKANSLDGSSFALPKPPRTSGRPFPPLWSTIITISMTASTRF